VEVRAEAYSVPKVGVTDAENEDSYAGSAFDEWLSCGSCAFAVADGATEASYSRLWSNLLTQRFVQAVQSDSADIDLVQVAASAADEWRRHIEARPLPWYAAEKAASGSFAAFAGLQLLDQQADGETVTRWRALAVGDCCLFVVRQGCLIERFPIQRSDDIGSSPYLLPTRQEFLDPARVFTSEGTCHSDDSILLMSDALAAWFLRTAERGEQPWVPLLDFGTQAAVEFTETVADLRCRGELRNDDTTLVRVDVFK
jgi:hypothetical protein